MKKLVIKNIRENAYYCEYPYACYAWDKIIFARIFDTKEEAENIIKDFDHGYYKIEEIYIF